MPSRPIRVVVADDSDTVRHVLRQWLTPEAGFEIAAEARGGAEAVEQVGRHRPDIVVMDVDMPGMDGLEATRRIMERSPTPIVIFTSSFLARQRRVAFEALAAGALDVFHKPSVAPGEASQVAEKLRKLLALLAPIKVIRRQSARPQPAPPPPVSPGVVPRMLAIAASTGGPVALARVLGSLPPTFPACTLLVQHQAPEFMAGFVEWLGDNVSLPVKLAVHEESLRPGVVLVAPGDQHMRLGADGRVRLDREPPLHACRPAADALFASVARAAGPRAMGVLLTGMGRDGAQGLLEMRGAGAVTVAQDEESSVVYGMPKTAAELEAATHVLPLDAIGEFLLALATERRA